MALILAIEPDRRQAAQLTDLVRRRVKADLVLADTTERALGAIGNRVPDLVLVPTLLSPQDDAALAGALRLIATAAHVQMLTIPVFAERAAPPVPAGFFSRFRKRSAPASTGCDPSVFADQIATYLADVAAARETALEDGLAIEAEREIDDVGIRPPITELIAEAPRVEEPVVAHIETFVAAPILEPLAAQIEGPLAAPIGEPPALEIEGPSTRAVEDPVIGVVDGPPMRAVEEPLIHAFEAAAVYEPAQTAYRSVEPPVVETFAETVAPSIDAAAIELPRIERPAIEHAAIEQPALEQAAIEQPALERPAIEQPALERPALEQAAIEQPAIEEPALAGAAVTALSVEPVAAEPTHATMAESIAPVVDAAFEPPLADPIAIAIWQYMRTPVPEPAPPVLEQPIAAAIEEPIAAPIEEPTISAIEPAAVAIKPAAVAIGPAAVAIEPTTAIEPEPEPARSAAARVIEFRPTKPLSQAELDLLYFVETGSPPPELSAARKAAPKPASKPARNDWSELVASLRVDVERMRAEQVAPGANGARALDQTPAARQASAAKKPKGERLRVKEPQPVQNEWGFFDPAQCGFAALLAKLDEITETPDDASVQAS
jgi:hypothetical protein